MRGLGGTRDSDIRKRGGEDGFSNKSVCLNATCRALPRWRPDGSEVSQHHQQTEIISGGWTFPVPPLDRGAPGALLKEGGARKAPEEAPQASITKYPRRRVTLRLTLRWQLPGDQSEEDTQPEPSNALGDTAISPNEAEPVTLTFLETLFGAISADIAILKQHLAKDIKELTKDMNELGDRVDTLERTSDTQGKELDGHQRELLELQDKNAELRYQVEDLENRSRRANIRIEGVPLQAAGGYLEDYTHRLFHHIAPEHTPQEITIDTVHRAGRPATSPGQPQNILTCLHYYRQK
ncbi:hypothetical protein NDU88_002648 [Pleurodeles waltl]|uniref:Uncharacterized protein n=1 Tax=Pleurodeles waltl TaxID=8319 RepID=A0AAV7WP50_PLEWA|nr:hypothetical protein NDU88_002648 [Pleurodeles waltl]